MKNRDTIDDSWQSVPLMVIQRCLQAAKSAKGRGPTDRWTARAYLDDAVDVAHQHPDAMADAAAAILLTQDNDHVELLKLVALQHAEVLDALADLGARGNATARGLHAELTKGGIDTVASVYAWWLDKSLYTVPAALGAPTATWLGDATFEAELRARIERAVESLLSTGVSDETEVTGALLQSLCTAVAVQGFFPAQCRRIPP